jgi:uncharacterized membrane protein/protein-disulfide isomerase
MNEPVTHNPTPTPGRAFIFLAALLTIAALGISAYLSYISLTKGQPPAGCGSGSGCEEVLASKWSRWLGVPVSLLAVWVYIAVLAAMPSLIAPRTESHRIGRVLLSTAAAAIAGAALWFIYLQLFVLKAICPYCMAGHIIGLLLAAVLVWRLHVRHLPAGAIGLAGVVVIAVVQVNTATNMVTLLAPTPGMDSDFSAAGQRTVTVLDGQLVLNLNEEPLLGPPDAEQVMVVMLDYACPHCRHTHDVIKRFQADHPGRLAVVLLPTPLNHKCNPHAPVKLHARFDESCELSRIALAVYLADPAAVPAFDKWMFELKAPRSAESARGEAIQRVGRESFEQAYADPRMQRMIARNVYAYGQSGADRVPVLIVPGAPAVVGRVDDPGVLGELLAKVSGGAVPGESQ